MGSTQERTEYLHNQAQEGNTKSRQLALDVCGRLWNMAQRLPEGLDKEALEIALGAMASVDAVFAQDDKCPSCGEDGLWYYWTQVQNGGQERHIGCSECIACFPQGRRPFVVG